jgi:hypothetical protein
VNVFKKRDLYFPGKQKRNKMAVLALFAEHTGLSENGSRDDQSTDHHAAYSQIVTKVGSAAQPEQGERWTGVARAFNESEHRFTGQGAHDCSAETPDERPAIHQWRCIREQTDEAYDDVQKSNDWHEDTRIERRD